MMSSMITPLLAALIGGYEVILIGLCLAWMGFWIWTYFKASDNGRK